MGRRANTARGGALRASAKRDAARNHPAWILLAARVGLALGVVTPDDVYAGALLASPLVRRGVSYDQQAQTELYEGINGICKAGNRQLAVQLFGRSAPRP